MNIRNGIENLGQTLPSQGTARKDAAPVTGKAGTEFLPADKAELSNAAGQLASTASASATASDVRTEKVAAIQSALQSGTYKVPASEVSRKIVSDLIVPEN